MTDTIKGLNCKVEVALTFDSSIAPTAVTKAYPGVVTLTSHGLTAGDVGYWLATSGMVQLHKQAFVVDNVVGGNSWDLSGLDTTNYDTFASGPTVIAAATWGTLTEASDFEVGGGENDALDDTRLIDTKRRMEGGLSGSQSMTITLRNARLGSAAMVWAKRMAARNEEILVKVTQASQIVAVAWGIPSLPSMSVSNGQLASGTMSLTVPAFVLHPESAIA